MVHDGTCHCGGVRVRLRSDKTLDELPVRACGCGYCQPQRARYTSDPSGHATIRAAAGVHLSAYRFGTKTADFVRCGVCGMLVAAVSTIDGRQVSVVSAALFPALRDREAATADFDGEGLDARLSRRARAWTPTTVTGGAGLEALR